MLQCNYRQGQQKKPFFKQWELVRICYIYKLPKILSTEFHFQRKVSLKELIIWEFRLWY